jgi:D-glycero-D-manno-heptose 1,7-bisphosphate phosphatase
MDKTKNIGVFIDRDGVINKEVHYLHDPDEFHLLPRVIPALKRLNEKGIKVIVVTNQSGIARGYYGLKDLEAVNRRMMEELEGAGVWIDKIYHCPHHPNGRVKKYRKVCNCRKPEPGMLLRASAELGVVLNRSYIIGDKRSDLEAGWRVGCRSILVLTGYGKETLLGVKDDPFPDLVAEDLFKAVEWILNERKEMSEVRYP